MRIMIKGGVWKNTEDEILKAAVMKYGLNQWARISSLLVRKSAKQCKARWYEWLDPAIKKTEWTREEDEKLLHLAKLMPTQWRTIAPIVGRTPAQCLERYEKLLDMAATKDENYDPADDPRRLRPGEIDPNPEAKPARPDPIDMDEDEKEMLSEARARLANTRGKKAKRKAREKQLEEARRLASLQKKRELKAAGIELRERNRRRRGVDYSKEIAFEKKPAIGFFDTGEEQERAKEMGKDFRPVTLEELEGKRRKDIEQALMKRDVDKQKIKERHDQPSALDKASELNDPQMMRRRGRLMLPAPQVSEMELAEIARSGATAAVDDELAGGAGGAATRALLGDYTAPSRLATPLRTPRIATAGGKDRVLQEAENLARLQQTQTPLLGGENPELNPSDFTGITPRAHTLQTPHPLSSGRTPVPGQTPSLMGATPSRRAIGGISATPLHGATPSSQGPGATPLRTPLRDELGLNDPDAMMAVDSKREERARQAMLRNELMAGLNQLPAPKGQYEIEVPELPEDEEMAAEDMEEDAADADARHKAAEQARIEAELRKRPVALQRGLPRPLVLDALPPPQHTPHTADASAMDQAKEMLHIEMSALLHRDAVKYPIKEKKKEKRRKRGEDALLDLEDFPEDVLKFASSLVSNEVAQLRKAMGHDRTDLSEYSDAWNACVKEFIYIPSQKRYGKLTSVTNSDRLASVQTDFEGVRKEMEKEAQRAAKLEDKVKIVTAGLMQREQKLRAQGEALWQSQQKCIEELKCFEALREQEKRSTPARLEMLEELLAVQKTKEELLQNNYKMLVDEKDDLLRLLRSQA